ncbi:type II secretion system protein [Synoicihabitans lomoniglobus]|uniref:Type II secretion system protein n=1 Tax=Synoicihabitans lomoniglobus TaxID=2909285 RepID=A0AAF0A0Q2_9BACT|nr:type II secretion system GspH family protein [Opitutaceae bacterium LMO-M01]WED65173.1 type II secretion system protein [Opitutaceae bacterium LMO-M01]
MPKRSETGGFTLIEIIIVVTMIAIFMAMLAPAYQRITLKAQATTYFNDMRVYAESLSRHALERGKYPADQTSSPAFPAEMDGFMDRTRWTSPSPIGGYYDWDSADTPSGRALPHQGAIGLNRSNLRHDQYQQLDEWFDDGDLSTGQIRLYGGVRLFYLLENKSG